MNFDESAMVIELKVILKVPSFHASCEIQEAVENALELLDLPDGSILQPEDVAVDLISLHL